MLGSFHCIQKSYYLRSPVAFKHDQWPPPSKYPQGFLMEVTTAYARSRLTSCVSNIPQLPLFFQIPYQVFTQWYWVFCYGYVNIIYWVHVIYLPVATLFFFVSSGAFTSCDHPDGAALTFKHMCKTGKNQPTTKHNKVKTVHMICGIIIYHHGKVRWTSWRVSHGQCKGGSLTKGQ